MGRRDGTFAPPPTEGYDTDPPAPRQGRPESAQGREVADADRPPRRILISAFACRPAVGSEEAVGWNVVRELSRRNEVWVITAARNEPFVRRATDEGVGSAAHFVYVPIPAIGASSSLGFNVAYYFWQWRALSAARELLRHRSFDVGHHLTYGRYWVPSFLAFLPIPYLFGPVGGGESMPPSFRRELEPRWRLFERTRSLARALGELDPSVRRTIRRSAFALGSTEETAARLRRLGATHVAVQDPLAISADDLAAISTARTEDPSDEAPFRCVSVGRLLGWKGFDLALRAFARADLPRSEYWIVGDGPERAHLERLADVHGIADRVRFFGQLPRDRTLALIAACDLLLHPSLHDSGGFVCLEAMAAGVPIVTLDTGGPAGQVHAGGGVAVATTSRERAEREIADAITDLAGDAARYDRLVQRALAYAHGHTWRELVALFGRLYDGAIDQARAAPRAR